MGSAPTEWLGVATIQKHKRFKPLSQVVIRLSSEAQCGERLVGWVGFDKTRQVFNSFRCGHPAFKPKSNGLRKQLGANRANSF